MPDMHNLLVKLIDDVGDMGYGDPYNDTVPRILGADVIRWAVAEIERHRMTPEERDAAGQCAADSHGAAVHYSESDAASQSLHGYLARTESKEVGRE